MCEEALKLLHTSHMGIVKTKNRARTSFFWPNLNQDIENCLSKCRACSTYQEKQPAESLLNDPASTKPWTALAMDNFELNGRHYLIIVDRFSKFTVVKHSQDLTSDDNSQTYCWKFSVNMDYPPLSDVIMGITLYQVNLLSFVSNSILW